MNSFNFRHVLALMSGVALVCVIPARAASPDRLNVVLITADDMNYNAPGFTGCAVPDITPNLDRLAAEGMWFVHGHVTIAVCQPSRSVLMTGRYPHNNGAMGFQAIRRDVTTLGELLRAAGYMNGILGKVNHLAPQEKFCWDTVVEFEELGCGRSPEKYYQNAKAFLGKAAAAGKPFFLMANSHDPHRPFAGSDQEAAYEKNRKVKMPGVRRRYRGDEIQIPGFLPELADVRREVAEYYTSVHRCDETVGVILKALAESGQADKTLVMFLSDNGMAFPFAKTNVYLSSTRTPWLVRWPGTVKPGRVDRKHFISGIDFMPTVLDAVGLKAPTGMDGRSFAPVLRSEKQAGRESVYTVFNRTAGRKDYPMRSVQNARFGYIYNAWPDGKTIFRNESQSGRTFKAMQAAAETDSAVAARVKLFQYRVREELYDFAKDPDALTNLIDDPALKDVLVKMRAEMLATMKASNDPLLETFQKQIRP